MDCITLLSYPFIGQFAFLKGMSGFNDPVQECYTCQNLNKKQGKKDEGFSLVA